ncbi:MAG: M3 family metallopeptidase, partial [Actinomycetota bacterium]
MSRTEANPLFTHESLPNFESIRTEDIEPGIRQLIKELEENVSGLEETLAPTWDGLVARRIDISEPLSYGWGIVHNLHSVRNNPELRAVYETLEPEVVQISLRVSQSKPIYKGLKALRDGPQRDQLDRAQKRAVEIRIRDAALAGVGLEGQAQARFSEIVTELSALGTR